MTLLFLELKYGKESCLEKKSLSSSHAIRKLCLRYLFQAFLLVILKKHSIVAKRKAETWHPFHHIVSSLNRHSPNLSPVIKLHLKPLKLVLCLCCPRTKPPSSSILQMQSGVGRFSEVIEFARGSDGGVWDLSAFQSQRMKTSWKCRSLKTF